MDLFVYMHETCLHARTVKAKVLTISLLVQAVKRLLLNIKAKDFSSLISTYPGEDPKMLANFKDLLDRVFVLDPEKRLTVSQALSHPFITGK